MKKVLVDICTSCSAKCKYCLHQYRNMVPGKMMSKEVFYKIIDILTKEKYFHMCPYLSGEPLLHPQYWEFMTLASNAGIMTNTASKLYFDIDKKKMISTFSSLSSPMHFDITIDADNQDIQNKIAKNINNDKVYENLKTLVSSIDQAPVSVSVITVVNAFNEDRLQKILEMIHKCGVKMWHPKSMGYYMGYKIQQEDKDTIACMEPKWNIDKRFSIKNGEITSYKLTCESFLVPVIGVDGQVTICCHDMLYQEAAWNVIDTGSLDAIVYSKEYRAKINLAMKLGLSICKGCN